MNRSMGWITCPRTTDLIYVVDTGKAGDDTTDADQVAERLHKVVPHAIEDLRDILLLS